MSERITPIDAAVSSRTLLRAVIRLDTRKHPAKVAEIEKELARRLMERRAA
jgi:hypothetical protein